jgi:nitroreductase
MFEKRAITNIPITDILALRWSGRAYDPERLVETDKLEAVLEAARWSPSCYGDQPWRYLVWDRHRDPTNWSRAFACLAEGNQTWAKFAPVLLLAAADTCLRDGPPNRWGAYDTGAASMSLSVQATALGLMVHQMGGFDAGRIRAEFAIPERFECMAMLTLGYQLPPERIPAEWLDREMAPRSRVPLEEIAFAGEWGSGLSLS